MQNELEKRKQQALENGLQTFFTPWQMRIIGKRLKNTPLSESERVEFSKNIRKKIQAIQDLQDLYLLLR